MSKTIEEINCRVILIPTNNKIALIGKYPSTGALVLNLGDQDMPRGDMQEMLIISDQKIESNNWIYCHTSHKDLLEGDVFFYDENLGDTLYRDKFNKIIASSERSPHLSRIPIEFVIEYANNNGNIDEIAIKLLPGTEMPGINKKSEIIILGEAKKHSKREVLSILREDLKKTNKSIEEYKERLCVLPIESKERKGLNEKNLSLTLLTIGIKYSIDLLEEEL